MGACGHMNATMSDTDLRSARRKTKETANFLSPPAPRPCFPRSASSHVATDTEDSESEHNNYFSLLQSSQSCRALYTPVGQTSAEKSLHRQLQKKQLYQQTRHDHLPQRSSDVKQRRYRPINWGGESSPSSPDTSSGASCTRQIVPQNNAPQICSSPLVTSSKLTQPTSPLFDDAQPLHSSPTPIAQQQHHNHPTTAHPTTNQTADFTRPPLTDSRQKDSQPSQKQIKKKRYSKRCKKRCGSLSSENGKPNHLLEVPALVPNRRVRSNKQTTELTGVLVSAKSDTQVSQAGRGMTSELDQDARDPFHQSQSKMSKDYKSLEWDRRYFQVGDRQNETFNEYLSRVIVIMAWACQIQEEMDLCLKGEFNKRDRGGETIKDTVMKARQASVTETPETRSEHTELPEPDAAPSPVSMADPLDVHNSLVTHCSHSAPNSPLNRRLSLSFSSGSESSDEEDVDNENTSDKNNADDDNDTSNSSNNDDVITIRLQPPSPKAQGANPNQQLNNSNHAHVDAAQLSSNLMKKELHSITMNSDNHVLDDGCYIELKHHTCCAQNNVHESNYHPVLNNIQTNPAVTAASTHSLSPANSPLPELVISSEGEMTLEETDDTLDGSPSVNRIKLRHPLQPLQHNKHRFRKKHQTAKGEMTGEKYSKSRKRPSFKNTFRIHRGKGTTKHILSKKTASNEKKASKVLGIIFLVFVILWTPFFTVNILSATCTSCIHNVNQETMSLFLWMGYIASLANPIIYTMFNTAFRRTFIRILTCKIQRTCSNKTSDNPYMSYTTMLASERRNTMTVCTCETSPDETLNQCTCETSPDETLSQCTCETSPDETLNQCTYETSPGETLNQCTCETSPDETLNQCTCEINPGESLNQC
ncbi:hypothetical protein Btru_023548 [Bulinus truncatus]|nr:hypothetical protein Btru_023548 [Bulinus truncatus]